MNPIHPHDKKRLDKLMAGDSLQQWAASHVRNLVEQRITDSNEIERLTTENESLYAVLRKLKTIEEGKYCHIVAKICRETFGGAK